MAAFVDELELFRTEEEVAQHISSATYRSGP